MKKIKLKGGYKGYLIGKTEKFEFGISTCGKLFVEIVDKSERPEFDNTSDYPNIWKYEIIEHLKTISPITCEIIYSTDTVGLDREECGMQDIDKKLAVFSSLETSLHHNHVRISDTLDVCGVEMLYIPILPNILKNIEAPFYKEPK